jgi:hypothetical protein
MRMVICLRIPTIFLIVDMEDIFKLTIWNESLHEISGDNGVRVVNFATSKNLSQRYDVPTSQHS